jgi:hypothetical protein
MSRIKRYSSIYKNKKLSENLSFLQIYKHFDEEMMKLIEALIQKFNAPRAEVCRELATLFDTLASEAENKQKALEKKKL